MVGGRGIEEEMSRRVEKAAERRGECVTSSERTMHNSEQRISCHTPLMSSLPSPQCYWVSDPAGKNIASQTQSLPRLKNTTTGRLDINSYDESPPPHHVYMYLVPTLHLGKCTCICI